MLLSYSWGLPWSTDEYNPLSPCYPDPSRNATNVLVNYPLSWQGNYNNSQDVFYEVWLGVSPDSLFYQGFVTQMVNVTEHLYSFTPMLEPLTQYYWRIRAIAPTDTIWSGMWSFTTGEEFYQPLISVTPTSIYAVLTTAETSQAEITIANYGTAPLIWNSNIVLTRAEQRTGTNAYLTKENNKERELNAKIDNIDTNSIRDKDMNREGTSPMPEINLSPSSGTIEPNSSVICILNFIPGDSLGTYNYELQLSSNDPVSPLITVTLEYVVTSPIAYIPDNNFRRAINAALGQPSDYQPTIADLNALTGTLSAAVRNITSIEGAQYLINLQDLDLYYNQISGLSPLAGLTNLQLLYLNNNQISDLSPLAGLSNLQKLYLGVNQISDLSPLAGLTNLQGLNLTSNQISDLSPLAGLTNLSYLLLENNQISDLSPLAGLTNLQELWLSNNQISNLSPLEELTNLQDLALVENQISDLSPLTGLSNLQYLTLYNNQISDLSPLAGLSNLRTLHLGDNQISDLSPLTELTNLQQLGLQINPISYESMLLSQNWYLPWSTDEYNSLSPCYPVPNRDAINVSIGNDLFWQGNYGNSQDVFYEVWLGISPDSLFSQGLETQMVNATEHLYSFTPMLEPLTQYYWRIRAIAPTDTIWSGMWSFTTGEEFYQPIISVTPTNIYAELTTAETSQTEITIVNYGTATLIWNSNIVLTRAEQKTGTNAYLTKENNTERELNAKIENIDANSIRDKDINREGTSQMPEINLSPSSGTIEPNSSVTCILNFIPGDSLGSYNYELQLSSNDPSSPLITVTLEYVVTTIAYIPDNNFRMAINEALGQPSEYQPTIADLNGLTGALSANERNIISIVGAQYLTHLQYLYLNQNQISDLSPLAGLTNLQYLYLGDNQISDLSPLAGLINLRELNLYNNQISDLSPLVGLTNLRRLGLYDNQISDLSPLACLTNLLVLWLKNNQISDLSPLAGLTNLQYLYLWSNQINDLSPLEGLTNLQFIHLSDNQISDLSPLAGLTNLHELELGSNQISDLSPLAVLTNLNFLDLSGNQIIDLSPLAGLTNLQELWLSYNQISDLSPLEELTNLQELYLHYNQISDLSHLAGLTNLQELWLSYNQISDLSPLEGLTNLQYLYLQSNQISDLSPLEGLTNLQYLLLWSNQISDLSPLAELSNLQKLWLNSNQISDLSPLAGLTNLNYLNLNYNQISDLSPLDRLTNLQQLYLCGNKISDLNPLLGMTHLVYLYLDYNPISYESMLLSQSWSLPWSTNEYNSLSPCYPDPSRNATNVLVNYPLSWQGNYDHSQDVFYEVWLGFSSDNLSYIGSGNHISGTQYSFYLALQSDTQYYWRIRAIAPTDTIWSGMWSFSTGSYGAGNMSMLEPVSVTLAINALQNEVRLSWQRRRDDESYYVYWSENPYAEFPEGWNGPVNVTETNYTDTLTDKCFYRVFAMPSIRGETENKQNTKQRAIMPGRGE